MRRFYTIPSDTQPLLLAGVQDVVMLKDNHINWWSSLFTECLLVAKVNTKNQMTWLLLCECVHTLHCSQQSQPSQMNLWSFYSTIIRCYIRGCGLRIWYGFPWRTWWNECGWTKQQSIRFTILTEHCHYGKHICLFTVERRCKTKHQKYTNHW